MATAVNTDLAGIATDERAIVAKRTVASQAKTVKYKGYEKPRSHVSSFGAACVVYAAQSMAFG